MTKKNEQIAARKPLRRRSWLSRLWRDERGLSEIAGGTVYTACGIAVCVAGWNVIEPRFQEGVTSVADSFKAAVTAKASPAQGAEGARN